MYILAINSSYRGSRGYTQFLIDRVFSGATSMGAECETVVLAGLKVNRCLACDKCHTEKSFLKCIYEEKDDVKSVFNKMEKADIIIYATPVYIFSMSGLLKIFLDRFYSMGNVYDLTVSESGMFFHHINPAIASKPFVPLICCDNVEDETPKNVITYFQTFSKFMDAPQVGLLVRSAGGATGHGNDPEKEKKFPKIRDSYKAYEKAGIELATKGRIGKATQNKANQKILPWVPRIKSVKERILKKVVKGEG